MKVRQKEKIKLHTFHSTKFICGIDTCHIITSQKLVEETVMNKYRLPEWGLKTKTQIVSWLGSRHLQGTKTFTLNQKLTPWCLCVYSLSNSSSVSSFLCLTHTLSLAAEDYWFSTSEEASPSISLVSWSHDLFFIIIPF